ncbi:prolyl aminopeptidase [Candidatus Venteria ishoeyi]|uniref:prolyl aminopeptidase n=1 Tax=Candidatus Venteria ishoeyi TaxID=1899563 RepID=UPI0025A4E079|nr:prolyl aminopeptidase [Candidatus Venteria ishoeyi]MDM8548164.1 prolyl aminopeptidase [Candidatus Venteria ishoeyi]
MSNTLYPEIKPYSTFHLSVSSLHSLYVEESGNPEGLPVVFLHGGPGAGCDANHRRYFDPKDYRIILFDQRGCGRSTPHAALQDNTTQALISDIEAIREHLNIQQWVVAGGSWGTTLGLAYAQTYPQQVLGLILRGIFLCRQADLDWLYGAGTRCFFPQEWQAFVEFLPSALSDDVIAGYYQLVTSDDAQMRLKAARAWATWEGRPATLLPNAALVGHLCEEKLALSLARISTHYFTQHCFLHNQQLLTDIGRIQNIPGMIVHGRYDMLCPVDNAWTLQKNWPKANLDIVADAGHAAGEPGIIRGLIKAANNMAGMLSG